MGALGRIMARWELSFESLWLVHARSDAVYARQVRPKMLECPCLPRWDGVGCAGWVGLVGDEVG